MRCQHCGVELFRAVDGLWLDRDNTSYYCSGTHDDPDAQMHEGPQ